MMRTSIMTEKISRRGVRPAEEYLADSLGQVLVREVASSAVVSIYADDSIAQIREWLVNGAAKASHQGFPVVDRNGTLIGVVTRRDLNDPKLAETQKCGMRSAVRSGSSTTTARSDKPPTTW
jgi:chloride channel protein, CIC family